MGKLHFGIVLGWSVVHSAVLWFLVNQVGRGGVDGMYGGRDGGGEQVLTAEVERGYTCLSLPAAAASNKVMCTPGFLEAH